ncbi:ATPase [Salipiger sp. P9]|uniref:ATP12 family chaperone protein n=1 Tax=Salipiger pentaromativorans TaxID=2943193 RepID=UPI0021585786|nr:ATP12 family protein [Salipiger pentaromativorans]MCR8550938.1 ATPase [Salipiger pentaromativorans]
MSEWAPRRFYKEASAAPAEGGFGVFLDGRRVMTPGKSPLVVPTQALADEIAAEWQAQDEKIDPTAMPFTRTANSAIEKVAPQRAAVAQMLAEYGDSDLLCYRADTPEDLVRHQAERWDPLLDWASETLGARLEPRAGIMHAPQDPAALETLSARAHDFDPFELAAFHDLVALSGSLILGFAATDPRHDPEHLWNLSRLDEDWQAERWGADEEAQEMAVHKRAAFLHAHRFFALCRPA